MWLLLKVARWQPLILPGDITQFYSAFMAILGIFLGFLWSLETRPREFKPRIARIHTNGNGGIGGLIALLLLHALSPPGANPRLQVCGSTLCIGELFSELRDPLSFLEL